MTARGDFDKLLATWLDEGAGAGAPGYLDETLDGIGRLGQRPAWRIAERWLPMQLTMRRAAVPRALPVLALLALILVAALAALFVAGSQRRVPPPFGPADNGDLAYVSAGQLWMAGPAGSGAHRLPASVPGLAADAAGAPVFSRDGTRVAYLAYGSAHPSLVIADADGSHPLVIAPDAEMLHFASWSSDDSLIAFSKWDDTTAGQHDRIFIAPTNGSTPPVQIGDPNLSAFDPLISPAGDRIAFLSDHCQPGDCPAGPSTFGLHVMGIDGTGVVEVAFPIANLDDLPSGFSTRLFDWSPDGRTILFTCLDPAWVDRPAVCTVASDGGSTQVRIDHRAIGRTGGAMGPSWSPAGDRVAFVELDGTASGDIVVTDPAGGSRRVIGYGGVPYAPVWSPDSRQLAFIVPERQEHGVVIIWDGDHQERSVKIPMEGLRTPSVAGADTGTISWQRR